MQQTKPGGSATRAWPMLPPIDINTEEPPHLPVRPVDTRHPGQPLTATRCPEQLRDRIIAIYGDLDTASHRYAEETGEDRLLRLLTGRAPPRRRCCPAPAISDNAPRRSRLVSFAPPAGTRVEKSARWTGGSNALLSRHRPRRSLRTGSPSDVGRRGDGRRPRKRPRSWLLLPCRSGLVDHPSDGRAAAGAGSFGRSGPVWRNLIRDHVDIWPTSKVEPQLDPCCRFLGCSGC